MPCPALHVYHGMRITGWLEHHTTCPECRFDAANFEVEPEPDTSTGNDELPPTVTLDASPPPPAALWAGSPMAMYGTARPRSQSEPRTSAVPMVELAVPVPLVGGYPLLSALEQSFDMLELSGSLFTPTGLPPFTTSPLAAGSQPVLRMTSASEPTAAQALPPHDQHTFFSALDRPPLVDLTESQPTRSFAAMLGARLEVDRDSWTPAPSTSYGPPPINHAFHRLYRPGRHER